MKKRLFRALTASCLMFVCVAATARAQTTVEWMVLSIMSARTLSASSPTTQAQCGEFGWLDLRVGQQLSMPCLLVEAQPTGF